MRLPLRLSICLALVAPAAAWSHDLTIFPRVSSNALTLRLHLGDPGAYQPIEPVQLVRMQLIAPDGEVSEHRADVVRDTPDQTLASAKLPRPIRPGLHMIASVYDNRFATFDAKDVAIGTTKDWRPDAVDSAHFIKFAKTLFISGKSGPGFDRKLGARLEFVPLADPFGLPVGARLPVQVLFDGQPLAGHKVEFGDATTSSLGGPLKTDDRGVVEIALSRAGVYRLAVDMRAKSPYPALYDFDDYTASLVFER
ncbi:DUF4198 domain-containing protein [Caulobacter sp. RHG1]|uniref:DUF4198 domain-containing protein n=1 Tax=Caulobacter sp. (strain RHG1) TaxID=2545762 RepID=UPI001552293B|nr:DUF4198 domain-containing protein [Caulobacter sp. RHG1]NQE61445.1 hypothetical protein [Caulobacter sp. RHG1]